MSDHRFAVALAGLVLLATLPASPAYPQTMTPAELELEPEAPVGTGFTYQGYLTQVGLPATGAWDFEFLLFDDAAAGTQQGSTVTVGDLAVSAGVFTATLDFGPAAFGGGARWLEIHVRPGASGGGYSSLVPRQRLAPAPMALSLPNVYTDEAASFVGVGRSFQVTGSEAFGVRAVAGAGQYGGMYMDTSDAAGWPFYGYATNGAFRAWTYYKTSDCPVPPCSIADVAGWKLYAAGTRLAVPPTGGLRIGPSADYSLVIENTTGSDGIRVLDTGDDAIQIGSSPDYANYGVYIPSPGVATYGLWPNTATASGEWALYTVDNIQAGNVFAAGETQIARVDGSRELVVGDVVAAVGFAPGVPGTQQWIPRIAAADRGRMGVIGVVRSRMGLVPRPGKEGDDGVALESLPGAARPGDFVALTVRGVTMVKIGENEMIEVGERLTVADSGGAARALQSRTVEGMTVTEGSPVIGVAVGAVDDESGLAPVYVMLP